MRQQYTRQIDRTLRQRFLFFRFVGVFGVMTLMVVSGFMILSILFWRDPAREVWIIGCSAAFLLPFVGWGLAIHAFRDIARPLAQLMDAAEVVAAGNLNVQIDANAPGGFGRLIETFNRMVRELARTDEQRRNLTADIAHELRTPLHIIQGNLEGVLDGIYAPTDDHIQSILDETQLLARLVEDLRVLSLAEAGQLVLRKTRVLVGELLSDVETSFEGQAAANDIALQVRVDEDVAKRAIEIDVVRINQVLGNLLVNALRHTPAGGTITLKAMDKVGQVGLIVQDTGPGIPVEQLPFVFDRFWRGDAARTRQEGMGGGLGLAIVKQLVAVHDGSVEVASIEGEGAVFGVWLPVWDEE